MQLIDIGVNLSNRRFQKDRERVIKRAINAGVIGQILTGVNINTSLKIAQFCDSYHLQMNSEGHLWCTAGVHPHDSSAVETDTGEGHWLHQLRDLLQQPRVVAVGECGLDYDRDYSPRAVQRRVFESQIELAIEHQLPLFLHERAAHQDMYERLSDAMSHLSGAVIHCFTGDLKSLERYLDLGCFIGITGWVCDERRGLELQSIVKHIPLDRILVETDAPFLTPRTLRPKPKGGRNEPAFLPHIVEVLAKHMEVDLGVLSKASLENTQHLFQISLSSP